MNNYKHLNIILLTTFILCLMNGYGQIITDSDAPGVPPTVDYSAPKSYEIGGITSSGTAPLDQRLLLFRVGDIIKIPGDEISTVAHPPTKTAAAIAAA